MLVTIITVVFNDKENIRKTIESVINQSVERWEYIVVDGGSTDGTLDIILEYQDRITKIISETDKGIFNAMNKGVRQATGQWINFMNSGDFFYSDTVIEDVFNGLSHLNNVSLIYGDKVTDGIHVPAVPPRNAIESGGFFACHQSMFFRAPISYKENFQILSDFELILRLYADKTRSFIYTPNIICNYADGGFSSVVRWRTRLERYYCLFRYIGVRAVVRSLIFTFFNKFRS
ncbi:glycosyltransferase [Gammaproteobacteria bacterium]|nr:glycosyltransferase [Gammaproteobacteria bacterium]